MSDAIFGEGGCPYGIQGERRDYYYCDLVEEWRDCYGSRATCREPEKFKARWCEDHDTPALDLGDDAGEGE